MTAQALNSNKLKYKMASILFFKKYINKKYWLIINLFKSLFESKEKKVDRTFSQFEMSL